jgi:hypothetical protein
MSYRIGSLRRQDNDARWVVLMEKQDMKIDVEKARFASEKKRGKMTS